MAALLFLTTVALLALVVLLLFLLVSSKQQESAYRDTASHLKNQIHEWAQEQFRLWREGECEAIRNQRRDIALKETDTQLRQWIYQSESAIRTNAIQRNQSVIIGKVTEHLVPNLPQFPFNPKDVRFVGSPIDLIIFDGMSNENIQSIVFVEVKTGASASLTKRERQIRSAVEAGKVKWLEMRVDREV